MNYLKRFFAVFVLSLLVIDGGFASDFPFSTSIMGVDKIKPGQRGVAYTVVSGTSVVSFPVTVISVIPQDGDPDHLIAIKAEGPVIEKTGGIAAGMSGSPVYIDGRLIGAIGYGWNFSDHRLGLVTPIEDMAKVFSWTDKIPPFVKSVPIDQLEEVSGDYDSRRVLSLSGVGPRAQERLSEALGSQVMLSGGAGGGPVVETVAKLSPGDAIGVLLAWGDVTLGATGTLSALSTDGRFLAFAHPFIQKGSVAYPLTKAWIHHVVPSVESPFKIGSFGNVIGTVTQDRAQAIGGVLGAFPPSVDLAFRLYDRDEKKRSLKGFRVVSDPFLVSKIAPPVFLGLMDRTWGRKGAGTAKMTISFDGGGLYKGWSHTDFYFSPDDISDRVAQAVSGLVSSVILNPYRELLPLGVNFEVEVSSTPRILYIDRISLDKETYGPGDTVEVSVHMRPYRAREQVRKFYLSIPEGVAGPCQVTVRGGGLGEPDGGQGEMDRSISNLDDMLKELSDREKANEVVIELSYQPTVSDDRQSGMLPPTGEYPGEVRRRKIKEGSMRVYRSDYYVEGALDKSLVVLPGEF
ncbi:SpoIVB peptidase S55 domain-containing protein [Dethiosulfovibrio salsuginis]|uniref:SpoIVB peptidase S55 n=1 Tax=Dethiosulfovibrio salsuginis TaxID=561720 RepID=A0A1X7I8X4_9BACT|nr:SpoIVB peptidase S55 domain-containing protein [Dethiosulfovibrio salsuginis]SMG10807.1 SpoIVB peptidase S55 [Dethiosulfovibrio salsuginis]